MVQKKAVSKLIFALAFLQLCAAILCMEVLVMSLAWTALNVVNDTIIAFTIVRSLLNERPLYNYTRSRLVRLVRLIIATGLLTIVANLISLAFLVLPRRSGWFATAMLVFMPKLYANSILVMLNNRKATRNWRNTMTNNKRSTNVFSTLINN